MFKHNYPFYKPFGRGYAATHHKYTDRISGSRQSVMGRLKPIKRAIQNSLNHSFKALSTLNTSVPVLLLLYTMVPLLFISLNKSLLMILLRSSLKFWFTKT